MNLQQIIIQRFIKLFTGLDPAAFLEAVKNKDFTAVGPMVQKLAVLLGFDAYGKEAAELLAAIAAGNAKPVVKNVADLGYLYAGYVPLPDNPALMQVAAPGSLADAVDDHHTAVTYLAWAAGIDPATAIATLPTVTVPGQPPPSDGAITGISWLDALLALIRLWLDWKKTPAGIVAP